MRLKDQTVLRLPEDLQMPSMFHLAAKEFVLMANLALTRRLKTTVVPIPTAKVRTNALQTP